MTGLAKSEGLQGAHRGMLGEAPRPGCRRRGLPRRPVHDPPFRLGDRLVLDRRGVAIRERERSVPVDRWTHLAITWDQGKKKAGIYLDGRLDVAETPEGVTDGVLGGGLAMLRLGGHTWQSPAPNLNGLLDEVRVSSVVREYRPLPGSEKDARRGESGATAAGGERSGFAGRGGAVEVRLPLGDEHGPDRRAEVPRPGDHRGDAEVPGAFRAGRWTAATAARRWASG